MKYLGGDIQVAHGGPAVRAAMDNYLLDVVLLDIGMPDMDGYEVVKRIRQQHEFDNVTLIALTGWGQADDRRRPAKQVSIITSLNRPISPPYKRCSSLSTDSAVACGEDFEMSVFNTLGCIRPMPVSR